ncbi:MAG: CPXCG motif-containing cysteine-rich protein [Thermomonas sp.]
MFLDMQDVECPYCGEVISLALDGSAGSQRYIEDCHVCCRPITVMLDVDADGDACVRVQSEEDT